MLTQAMQRLLSRYVETLDKPFDLWLLVSCSARIRRCCCVQSKPAQAHSLGWTRCTPEAWGFGAPSGAQLLMLAVLFGWPWREYWDVQAFDLADRCLFDAVQLKCDDSNLNRTSVKWNAMSPAAGQNPAG